MTFSKSALLNLVVLTILITACSKNSSSTATPTSYSADAVDSSFVVDTPILLQAKQSAQATQWSLASQNDMTLKACIKDSVNDEAIIGEEFDVSWDNSQQTQKTDIQGCLTWTQSIAFDYLKDESYIASPVRIDGKGTFHGSRNLPLAFDPWAIDSTAMVDMRLQPKLVISSSSGMNGALAIVKSAFTKSNSQTVVDKVMVQALDNQFIGNSEIIHYRLLLSPQITHQGIKGGLVAAPLVSGHFRLSLILIEHRAQSAGNQDLKIELAENSVDALLENGSIKVDVPMSLQRKPDDQSLIELAFQLKPIDPPFELLAREGFVQLSSLNSGGDPSVHDLSTNFSDFQSKIRSQISSEGTKSAGSLSCDDGSSQLGFFLSFIDVRNAGVISRTQNENVPNSEFAAFTTCLSDTESRKPVSAGISFDASLSNPDGGESLSQTLLTDGNGCLHFTNPVNFDFFSAETWIDKNLRLVSHSAPYLGVVRSFPVSIDPWQNKEQFFWDCRNGQKPASNGKRVEMDMTDFSANSIGQDYSIDAGMNLTVSRHYQFQITPRLKISSAYGGGTSYQDVADGNYHLRVLVLTSNEDTTTSDIVGMSDDEILTNYKYLSSYESDVKTRDGRITQDVVLPVAFSELPLLGLRNTVLIQIVPLNPSSSLISHTFYEAFVGMSASGYLSLNPVQGKSSNSASSNGPAISHVDLDIESLIQTGLRSKATILNENTSIDALANAAQLKIPSNEELDAAKIDNDAIQSLLVNSQTSAAVARKLCTLFGASNSAAWLKSCNSKPLSHLQIAKIQHVEAVNSGAKVIDSKYVPMSVVAQISVSAEKSNGSSVDSSFSNSKSSSSDKSIVNSNSTDHSNTLSSDTSFSKGDTGSKGVEASASVRATGSVGTGIKIFGNGAEVGVETSAGVSASMGHSWFTTKSDTVSSSNSSSNVSSSSSSKGNTKSNSSSKTHTVSKTSSSSTAQSGSVNLAYNKDFGVEELVFDIKGDVRNCLVVNTSSKAQGILLCSQTVSTLQDWHESYYLVSELYGFSQLAPLRDAYSRSDAPLALAIRGDAAYNAVQALLVDKSKSILLSPTKIDYTALANLDRPLDDFARTTPKLSDGTFPSLIY